MSSTSKMNPMRRRLLRMAARIETEKSKRWPDFFKLMELNLEYHRLLVRRVKSLNRRFPRFTEAEKLLSQIQAEIDNEAEFLRTYRNPIKYFRTRRFEILFNRVS